MDAKFIKGNPEFVRYKPGSAVAAGDVILIGDLVVIAHSAIAASAWGNVAVGGGSYELVCGEAIAVGKRVNWDVADSKVNEDVLNPIFGWLNLHLAADADTDIRECLHRPYVDLIV